MEAGEAAGARQSGYHSARKLDLYIHPQQQQPPPSQSVEPQYREAPTMATATLISPSVPYHGYPTPYAPAPAPSYQNQQGTGGASTGPMISPVEPRRGSNESDSSHRQSLPSISEVISASKPSPYQPPAPAPATMAGSSFPSPYTSTTADKNPSPRQLQPPPSTFPPRQDPIPAYPDVSRPPSFSDRSAPSHPTGYPAPHPSPPIQGDKQPYSGDRLVDHHMNGAYPPPSSGANQPPAPYPQHGQLPPGQLPLTPFPASPRHVGPLPPTPYEPPRPPVADEAEFPHTRPRYDTTLSRHFEQWGYQENLGRIASSTRTIYNFAEAWNRIAQEQLAGRPIPDRLPSEREINDMLSNTEFIRRSLENVRDLVQQNNLAERGKKGLYDDEDVAMYGDGLKPTYAISEVKKRRGRAAPPGRCHSCNRIDTPEWRRGPDGARTLCNACGLHYAKLERKRQLEARSLRPKPPETR